MPSCLAEIANVDDRGITKIRRGKEPEDDDEREPKLLRAVARAVVRHQNKEVLAAALTIWLPRSNSNCVARLKFNPFHSLVNFPKLEYYASNQSFMALVFEIRIGKHNA
jgi:hypothetical protein